MEKTQFFKTISAVGRTYTNDDLTATPFKLEFFPKMDGVLGRPVLAAGLFTQITDSTDSSVHSIVISVQDDKFDFTCGEPYFEGLLTQEEADTRMADVMQGIPVSQQASVLSSMQRAHGALRVKATFKGGECKFARQQMLAKGLYICDHCKAAFSVLCMQPELLSEAANLMQKMFSEEYATAAMPKDKAQLDYERYAFKMPLVFEAKHESVSWLAQKFAHENKILFVSSLGLGSMAMADLRGQSVPTQATPNAWVDGLISEAIRLAQAEKVVLCIDGLDKVQADVWTMLQDAFGRSGSGYRLKTGRVIVSERGLLTYEILECPHENLAVFISNTAGSRKIDWDIALHVSEEIVDAQLVSVLEKEVRQRGFCQNLTQQLLSVRTQASSASYFSIDLSHSDCIKVIRLAEDEKEAVALLRIIVQNKLRNQKNIAEPMKAYQQFEEILRKTFVL